MDLLKLLLSNFIKSKGFVVQLTRAIKSADEINGFEDSSMMFCGDTASFVWAKACFLMNLTSQQAPENDLGFIYLSTFLLVIMHWTS